MKQSREPILVIQQIKTVWSKPERGGDGAIRRNAVPEAARIPSGDLTDQTKVVQHFVSYGRTREANYEPIFYAPHERVVINTLLNPIPAGCVLVSRGNSTLFAEYRHGYECGGAPLRDWVHKTLHAETGQWVRIAYNGRFSHEEGNWTYEKMVVNIGLFTRITPKQFTASEPLEEFRAMAHLL